MSRRIQSGKASSGGLGTLAGPGDGKADSYPTKLLKLIPAESAAAYLSLTELAHAAPTGAAIAEWVVFALILVATPLYLIRQTTEPGKKAARLQVAASTSAFLVWAYTIGGPFRQFGWYEPYWGSLAMIAATLLLPLLVDEPKNA